MFKPTVGPGTYALVLEALDRQKTRIGELGVIDFPAGHYVYVGSALGPGGLAARVGRHARGAKKLHWHVDYLGAIAPLVDVWYAAGERREECLWARALAGMDNAEVLVGRFGASDCGCRSHLFHFEALPSLAVFRRALRRLKAVNVKVRRWDRPSG